MISMSGRTFLDTNVLVYAYDRTDPAKQATASGLIERHLRADTGCISVQVLGEFYVTVTRKIPRPLALSAAAAAVAAFGPLRTVEQTRTMVCEAMALSARDQLSYWDALIVAAAERAGCETILSEDLQPGQSYQNIPVVNPFATA